MKKYMTLVMIFFTLILTGCHNSYTTGPNCNPQYGPCGGPDPKMKDQIANEVDQLI